MRARAYATITGLFLVAVWALAAGCSSDRAPGASSEAAMDASRAAGGAYSGPGIADIRGRTGALFDDAQGASPLGARGGFAFESSGPAAEKGGRAAVRFDPTEELWIVERAAAETSRSDDAPGSGCLVTPGDDGQDVPVPLEHTDVRAEVTGYVSTVRVKQRFSNPFATKIEAVYVFPLPSDAAVDEFLMTVGDRTIRGIIRDRAEAEAVYAEARAQGYQAALLTQERPNVFTQKVANIEPGRSIDIEIRYFGRLTFVDGSYELVFPMVVGPRFNPPGSTSGIGAVPRGGRGRSGQPTEVTYLRPEERSGHDIAVRVDVDAGVTLEGIDSPSHAVRVQRQGDTRATVELAPADRLPNRDFVLRFGVSGRTMKTALFTHEDARGGFLSLLVVPPADARELPRQPAELVFVLDCSGSMSGQPIEKAKAAVASALRGLDPDDTFQIIRFSESASGLGREPLRATRQNVERGLRHLQRLEGEGGTMMIEGIRAALDFRRSPERQRLVTFMTDGFIGNEAEIFAEVQQRIGDTRIFSFGIGSSVNRYLIEGLAQMGRGAVAYVGLDESAGRAVDAFYERIRHPALTDIRADWGPNAITDVFPKRIPDLFAGRPIVLSARYRGRLQGDLRLRGRVGDQEREIVVRVSPSPARHPGIASVWARSRLTDLEYAAAMRPSEELRSEIVQTALDFGLLSSLTAFLAVDSSRRTEGESGVTVPVPVPVPDGVRYETSVGH